MVSKKGLAEIITVILIILLSLAAIAIIWTVIKPVITKTTSQISLVCTTSMDLSIDYANCSSDILEVRLSRGVGEGTIKSIKFSFSSDTDSQTITLSGVTNRMPDELEIVTYEFDKSIYNITLSKINKVRIAPVIEGESGSEISCDVLDTKDCFSN